MIDQRHETTGLPRHLGRSGGDTPPTSPPLDPPTGRVTDEAPPRGTQPPQVVPPPPADPGRPSGWGRFLALAAVAAVTVLAAFGIGRFTAPEPEVREVPVTVAAAATPAPTPVPAPADPPPAAAPDLSAATPDVVADVAAAVSPTVVQLETGFGVGSGVIYDSDGYILTAAHVVGTRGSVTVRLANGSQVQGEVLGTDDGTDVAVVKIDGRPDLPVAELAVGEDVRVGQLAVALGSPFGLDQTVTSGIVSAVDRLLDGNVSFVQTDAAINPGNSGGPLVDARGRVIGINDQIYTQGGGNDGVGFAISIDVAKIVADQIVAGEPVQLAFLGVSTENAVGTGGVLIDSVVEGSAAALAGIEVGDTIIAVDGRPVNDIGDLRVRIITTPPGTDVSIEVLRNGQPQTVNATLGVAGE